MKSKSIMEELRKEYKDLGLTDAQILTAKCYNITPEQIAKIKEGLAELCNAFSEVFAALTASIKKLAESQEWQNLLKLAQDIEEKKLYQENMNSKGKPLKQWQKNKFYQ